MYLFIQINVFALVIVLVHSENHLFINIKINLYYYNLLLMLLLVISNFVRGLF